MKILKVGDRKKVEKRKMHGFTLLELLMVIAFMGVLSFSVVYGFKGRAIEPLKRGEEIISKLIKIGKRISILEECEVSILVHHHDKRLVCLKTENNALYELLPEGVTLHIEGCKQMIMEKELWDFTQFNGETCRLSLVLSEDETEIQRVNFDF